MRVALSPRHLELSGRFGPFCLACGNKQRFWVETSSGTNLFNLSDLPEGDANVVACGRCRSRHSLVVARID